MEEVIPVVVLLLFVTGFLIYYLITSEQERQRQNQAAEERSKKYLEDFQKIGEDYENSGIPIMNPDIVLKRGETLHAILRDTKWMEYRKVRTGRMAGHAITGRIRISKGLYYRYGAGQIVSESIDALNAIDAGDVYVTDKGLFFRGSIGNKNVPYGKIISILPYPDGLKIERNSGKDIYMPYDFTPYPEKAAAIAVLWNKSINSST